MTKNERAALLLLVTVLFTGTCFDHLLKRYPRVGNIISFLDGPRSYPKLNVNSAGKEELIAVPYIGEYTAEKILRYRQAHGPFHHLDQLRSIEGIYPKNFEKFREYLYVK